MIRSSWVGSVTMLNGNLTTPEPIIYGRACILQNQSLRLLVFFFERKTTGHTAMRIYVSEVYLALT